MTLLVTFYFLSYVKIKNIGARLIMFLQKEKRGKKGQEKNKKGTGYFKKNRVKTLLFNPLA